MLSLRPELWTRVLRDGMKRPLVQLCMSVLK